MVLVHHFTLFTRVNVGGQTRGFDYLGRWGVAMFFVLTGYLLAKPYLRTIVDGTRFPSSVEFFKRRFFRLYPLYVASLLGSVALVGAIDLWSILTHLVMIHGFFSRYITDINGPLWTMWVDVQFYILLPPIALALRNVLSHTANRTNRIRAIWAFLGACFAISMAERAISLALSTPDLTWEHMHVVAGNVIGMGSQFALGAGIALYEMESHAMKQTRFALFASVLGFITLMLVEKIHGGTTGVILSFVVTDPIAGLSAGALLYAIVSGSLPRAERLSGKTPVIRFASLAYAVYLVHFPIMTVAVKWYPGSLAHPIIATLFSISVLIPILVVAYAGHIAIERPFLRLRDRHRELAEPVAA